MNKQIPKEKLKTCTYCYYRHRCFQPCNFKADGQPYCKHWKLGKCLLCKYLNADEWDWFERNCECWCFGGCRKHFKRDWKATLKWWFKRIVEKEV